MVKLKERRASVFEKSLENGNVRVRITTDLLNERSGAKLASITQVFDCKEWTDLGDFGVTFDNGSFALQYVTIYDSDGTIRHGPSNVTWEKALRVAKRENNILGRIMNRHLGGL